MPRIGGLIPGILEVQLARRASSVRTQRRAPLVRTDQRDELRATYRNVRGLRRALRAMQAALKPTQASATVASATSSVRPGPSTQTVMRSTAELNSSPTSFSSHGATLARRSSAAPSVRGHDGTEDDVLTVKIRDGGTIGGDGAVEEIRFEVRDGDNDKTDDVNFDSDTPAGTEFTLSSGVRLSFGEGTLVKDDRFQIQVDGAGTSEIVADSAVTVGGAHGGSESDVLTIKVENPGTIGGSGPPTTIKLEVRDGDGDKIEDVTFSSGDPAGTPVELSNGLTLSFAEGSLVKDRKFQVNAVAEGASSLGLVAQPRLTGSYSGSEDERYTVKVKEGGTVGGIGPQHDIEIEVRDSDGKKTDEFTFSSEVAPGTKHSLSSGLELSFTEGQISKGAEFEISASATEPGVADPSARFDGSHDSPYLESAVTAGAFDLNGVQVDVLADDTIETVLDRINASSAGVTATYDAAAEGVILTRDEAGSLNILLENDTSGFLAAMKLTGADAKLGEDGSLDPDELLEEAGTLEGLQSGIARVNGVDISIDVTTDTLRDVVNRLDASGAGVRAQVDDLGKVRLTSLTENALVLDDGDSGLFGALGIEAGALQSQPGRRGFEGAAGVRVRNTMKNVARDMNALFGDASGRSPASRLVQSLRSSFAEAAERAEGGGARSPAGFGLRLDFSAKGDVFRISADGENELASALQREPSRVVDYFTKSSGSGGSFLDAALRELRASERELEEKLDGSGLHLDVRV